MVFARKPRGSQPSRFRINKRLSLLLLPLDRVLVWSRCGPAAVRGPSRMELSARSGAATSRLARCGKLAPRSACYE